MTIPREHAPAALIPTLGYKVVSVIREAGLFPLK
jgi:hypothetical protein